MKINIRNINKDLGASSLASFTELLPPVVIAGETFDFKEPVNVEVKVTNVGNTFVVDANIKTKFELICSRCLKPYIYSISTTMQEEYCRGSEVNKAEEDGIDIEELIIFNGDEINIQQEVIDTIVMALPMKPVCHQDCRGLCNNCGQNLNEKKCHCETSEVDPRLEILKRLNL